MATLRVGLIGGGKHGTRYARHIAQDLSHVRLVGIARRDVDAARAQADAFGCKAYEDYRDLIHAPDVDAVIVVVPPTLNLEVVTCAAAARRAVLLEKPAAPNLDVGRRMLDIVRAAGIPVMVAQTLRYNGVVRAVLDARSRIGRIHSMHLAQHFEPSPLAWIDDPPISGGGIILHTGVHSFDLLRCLSGLEPSRVHCEMTAVDTRRTEDNFSALIRLQGDLALASVGGSRATVSRSGAIELAGEHGQIIADHVLNRAILVEGASVTRLPVPDPVPTVREVLRSFVDALQRGAPIPVPIEDGLRAVAVCDACYRAARSGRAEPVAPL